jgi:hypothetical protein
MLNFDNKPYICLFTDKRLHTWRQKLLFGIICVSLSSKARQSGKTPAFILFITSLLADYWVHYNLATGQIDAK